MRHWIKSALIKIMACRLVGAKPLPEPKMTYCQLDPSEQSAVILLSKLNHFHWRHYIWKCRLCIPKWWPSCPSLNVTNTLSTGNICLQCLIPCCKHFQKCECVRQSRHILLTSPEYVKIKPTKFTTAASVFIHSLLPLLSKQPQFLVRLIFHE